MATAITVVKNKEEEEKAPAYLKLIYDCWEHIFDYLSVNDILQIGSTCKHMEHASDQYLQQHCPNLSFYVSKNKIYGGHNKETLVHPDFHQNIKRLCISNRYSENLPLSYRFIASSNFDSLQTLVFKSVFLDHTKLDSIQKV